MALANKLERFVYVKPNLIFLTKYKVLHMDIKLGLKT